MHSFGAIHSGQLEDHTQADVRLRPALGLRESLEGTIRPHAERGNLTCPIRRSADVLGTVEYQATCKCNYANAYPYAIGPHLGVAYQINSKTVFRAGGAISYAATSDQAGLNSSAGDFYQHSECRLWRFRRAVERRKSLCARQQVRQHAGQRGRISIRCSHSRRRIPRGDSSVVAVRLDRA